MNEERINGAVEAIEAAIDAVTPTVPGGMPLDEAVEVWHRVRQHLGDNIDAALDEDPSLADARPGPGGPLLLGTLTRYERTTVAPVAQCGSPVEFRGRVVGCTQQPGHDGETHSAAALDANGAYACIEWAAA